MTRALALAERGLETTHPNPRVGCVIAKGDRIIAEGWHERAGEAHAEIAALRSAKEPLVGATAYVTLEPCVMCAGACYWFQLSRIVFGAYDTRLGFGRLNQKVTHPKTLITGGIRENECAELVRSFFKSKRSK